MVEVIIAVERINDVIDAEPEEDLQHQARQFLPPRGTSALIKSLLPPRKRYQHAGKRQF